MAERLGIASPADIYARRDVPTPDQLVAVRAWLDECEIAWIVYDGPAAATRLEACLKAEHARPVDEGMEYPTSARRWPGTGHEVTVAAFRSAIHATE